MKHLMTTALLLLVLSSCRDTHPVLSKTVMKRYEALGAACARNVQDAIPVVEVINSIWTERYSELASAVTTTLRDTGAYLLSANGAQLEITRKAGYYHVGVRNTMFAYSETFPTLSAEFERSGMSSALTGHYEVRVFGYGAEVILDALHVEGQCETDLGTIEFRPLNRMSGKYHGAALPEIDFSRDIACSGSDCEDIGSDYLQLEGIHSVLLRTVTLGALFPVNFRKLVQQSDKF